MPAFHVVSDFDGVWTDPDRETAAVEATIVRELARVAGLPLREVAELFARQTDAVLAEPERHGWLVGEVLTSYVDEDAFALPSGVCHALAANAEGAARRVCDGVAAAFGDMDAFLQHCYHSTCERFRAETPHDLTRGAEKVMAWIVAREVQVTVVTNAPTAKVVDWFGHHGIAVADALDPAAPPAALRVYGRAGKQWLGDPERHLDFFGRKVRTDRPQYRAILEREQPDLVVGDVLSLDLAQPLAMRVEALAGAPRHVVLLERPATPSWMTREMGAGPHRIDHRLPHVTALPALIEALSAGRSGRAARAGRRA